jgi:hypothetical protein
MHEEPLRRKWRRERGLFMKAGAEGEVLDPRAPEGGAGDVGPLGDARGLFFCRKKPVFLKVTVLFGARSANPGAGRVSKTRFPFKSPQPAFKSRVNHARFRGTLASDASIFLRPSLSRSRSNLGGDGPWFLGHRLGFLEHGP